MSDRPHSLFVPHVPCRDTHGWIGTGPGCLACAEWFGADYANPAGGSEKEEDPSPDHDPVTLREGRTPASLTDIHLPGDDRA